MRVLMRACFAVAQARRALARATFYGDAALVLVRAQELARAEAALRESPFWAHVGMFS